MEWFRIRDRRTGALSKLFNGHVPLLSVLPSLGLCYFFIKWGKKQGSITLSNVLQPKSLAWLSCLEPLQIEVYSRTLSSLVLRALKWLDLPVM